MEELTVSTEIEKLKLNVTNIKSVLIDSNKKLKLVDIKKSSLFKKEYDEKKRSEKEDKVEKVSIPGMGISKKILSNVKGMVMGIKDRILNFFGYLLLGFVIDKLPEIIKNVSSFLKTVEPIFKVSMNALGAIIGGIGKIYDSISSIFKPNEVKNNLNQSEKELKDLDTEISVDNIMSTVSQAGVVESPSEQPNATTNLKQNASENSLTPSASAVNPTPSLGIQKRKRGGSINKSSQINQQPKRSSIGNEKTNPLKLFAKTTDENTESINVYDKNISKFEDIVKVLKGIKKFGGDLQSEPQDSPPSSSGERTPFDPNSVPIDVEKNEVIGTLGSTGRSTGPHIHIESYSGGGESIPLDVKNNILVSGIPMPTRLRFESPIGWRESTQSYHAGEDYSGEPNQPISLTGGLKYVGYVKMGTDDRFAGYGNVVVIQDKRGKKYFLAHLNSGPKNEKELVKRQIQKKDPVADAANNLLKSFEIPKTPSLSQTQRKLAPISQPIGGDLKGLVIIPVTIPTPGSDINKELNPQSSSISPLYGWERSTRTNNLWRSTP